MNEWWSYLLIAVVLIAYGVTGLRIPDDESRWPVGRTSGRFNELVALIAGVVALSLAAVRFVQR